MIQSHGLSPRVPEHRVLPKKNCFFGLLVGAWGQGPTMSNTYMQNMDHDFYYTPKTNMTLEKQPFEDVSPTKRGDFPLSC